MKIADISNLRPLLIHPRALPDLAVTGVQCDSRKVRPHDLFVAVPGTHEDGLKYAAAAEGKGASAIIAENKGKRAYSIPVIEVKDARKALSVLASAAAGYPSEKLDLFGITGTNGKTTTAWILAELLKAAGKKTGLLTTVQAEYGDRILPSTRTTPAAPELHRLLREMVNEKCNAAVMEVSSHALDQDRASSLHFAGAIFTHLTQDHLDYHHTMEAYFEAKKKLFIQLAETTPNAPAVCIPEAPYGKEMAAFIQTLPLRLVTCGLKDSSAEYTATDISLTPHGTSFVLTLPDGKFPITFGLSGRYNVSNALCAAALAHAFGIAGKTIADTLCTLQPRWGRLERIPTALPATLFVDYAHTDDALANVLQTLREMNPKRLILVFGCGGDRDRTKRPLMGKACATYADHLIVTSDNPRSEDPNAIIQEILKGIPQGTSYQVEPDRRAAIHLALSDARPGDIILVAGKGHETTQEIGGRFYPFDDRAVLREEAAQLSKQS